MLKRFTFSREDRPEAAWLARFVAGREAARRWYLGETRIEPTGKSRGAPPTAAQCRAAVSQHMPELLPHYDRVCALVGPDELGHCVLSHYRPPPEIAGCSLAIWLGDGGPALIRQQDYPLDLVSERFEMTHWSERRLICKAQRPWDGCHDGMNDHGLAVSSTFGGSQAQGRGFSIILMLRYVLETCSRVDEAVRALCRIPVAMSHNVVVLDRSGAHALLYLGPDRAPAVLQARATTNHQETIVWPELAARSATIERLQALEAALDDPAMTLMDLTNRFFAPPLYSRRAASPTVYTAVFRPAEDRVDYFWPGKSWRQYFDRFKEGEYTHDYGELT
jgi:predicted choloylglycine hydrolase